MNGVNGLVVSLTRSELLMAGGVGMMRRTNGIFSDLQQQGRVNGKPREFGKPPWETDIVSAQSEYAVSKFMNLSWTGSRMDKPRDVGDLIEVKYVDEPHHRLPLGRNTIDDAPHVCVYAKDDKFTMFGWVFAKDGKIKKFEQQFDGREQCWMVDQIELRDMAELKAWVRDQK